MKALSRWAKRNPVKSRLLIALGHVLAITNAVLLGLLLFLFDWPASTLAVGALASVFFITYLYYPKPARRLTNSIYWRQKASDFTFVLCYSFLIAICLNNVLVREGEVMTDDKNGLATATVLYSAIATSTTVGIAPAPLTKAEQRKAKRSQFK